MFQVYNFNCNATSINLSMLLIQKYTLVPQNQKKIPFGISTGYLNILSNVHFRIHCMPKSKDDFNFNFRI